ncbi:hypothetical protein [Salarchaeum sp. JOR-1]|uniref:DUF7266 family protein n=1 Tax=Salarchaeum sp. JOR-1 TaxID=2599399 RepID=UPI0011986722|nr:hypothetical protein [Salarchaeum sp. JOR-1]QDX39833.1 hypothetical protein FQU85_02560 [Salarchaeum sp. JOR-1]
MDDRGVAPVVGKALEAGIVLLYVGAVAAAMYGSVVPDYRATAGDAVAERALAAAAEDVEAAIPARVRTATVRADVALPDTIRGRHYTVAVEKRTLVLTHPDPDVGARVRLSLPDSVTAVSGAWSSATPAAVRVIREHGETVVRLVAR